MILIENVRGGAAQRGDRKRDGEIPYRSIAFSYSVRIIGEDDRGRPVIIEFLVDKIDAFCLMQIHLGLLRRSL